MVSDRIRAAIRDIKDFPKPGILFKDITPVLLDPALCRDIVNEFIRELGGIEVDAVLGVESRGFFFGLLLAEQLGVPFIPARKPGKLPYDTVSHDYELEYGTASLEMHVGVVKSGMNVLIHDDLLATGGTASAAAELVQRQEGKVAGFAFIVGLDFLNGEEQLKEYSENILTLVNY